MNIYAELKSKNDILTVAYALGYKGKKAGKCYQGDCPKHGSTQGKCLVIWPRIQGFKCFHCGAKGDVIDLVMLYKKMEHKEAVKFLAERVGLVLQNGQENPEETAQREAANEEKRLVEAMLTEAAEWYHSQLKNFPDILKHLQEHYGFSEEIINELKIGFSPPDSALASYLNAIPEFKGKIVLSGLFNFKNPSGPFFDYFQGRIVFPYWKGGKVVYLAGRATKYTPKFQDNEPAKYIKLRTHDPEDEKRKFISRYIQNDVFLGEDHIRGEKEIVITEGAADWVSAVDKGLPALSPVTTSFREQDLEKLRELVNGVDSIYIINDNEENKAGLQGALKTGKYLSRQDKNVFIVELPREEGREKIDLNEYLKDHSVDELKTLMKESKSVIEILIADLPADFLKAEPVIREEIMPLLVDLDKARLQYYLDMIKKHVSISEKVLKKVLADFKKKKEKIEKKIDPKIEEEARKIAVDPLLFKKRIDAVNALGVVGERGTIAMYFCALDSRLLPYRFASSDALAVKNAGHFGAGKSFTLMNCLQIYPKSSYHLITNGSAKSLYYLRGGLKHKALVITEGFQFQKGNAVDSELVYCVRSLLSEGRVIYMSVEKDKDGNLITVQKKLEGPTSFITTTAVESLEPQLEDRLFTIHPDESPEQTKAVTRRKAEQKAGIFKGLDKVSMEIWKVFHKFLMPVDVVIPYAPAIVDFIDKNETLPLATRRALNRVLSVIQAIATTYQHQRKRDDQGRVIAEIADYWMALQIVNDAFKESLGAQDKKTEEYLSVIREKEKITPRELAKMFGVQGSTVSAWVGKRVKEGIIDWCDENGNPFDDERNLEKAKRSGKAYLKISENYKEDSIWGLPTPYELTKDLRWAKDGDLLKFYDLELGKRSNYNEVFGGVCRGVNTLSYSEQGNKPNNIIQDVGVNEDADRVIGANMVNKKIMAKNHLDEEGEQREQVALDDNNNDINNDINKDLTPYICRQGCKHYDSTVDVNDGQFKEFCWNSGGKRIVEGYRCKKFAKNELALSDDILIF